MSKSNLDHWLLRLEVGLDGVKEEQPRLRKAERAWHYGIQVQGDRHVEDRFKDQGNDDGQHFFTRLQLQECTTHNG